MSELESHHNVAKKKLNRFSFSVFSMIIIIVSQNTKRMLDIFIEVEIEKFCFRPFFLSESRELNTVIINEL